MKKIYQIAGLPRSGSTLLTNILLQNPKLHSTTTSSFLDFLVQIRDNWDKLEGHKTFPNGQDKWKVLRGITQTYHNTDKQIIFDKNRSWVEHIEYWEKLTGLKSRIICCTRNLPDITCSFETLFRKNRANGEIHGEFSNTAMKSLDGRIQLWNSETGVIGRNFAQMRDAYNRGLADRMFILPYQLWTSEPDKWFEKIYEFIGEPYFQHDFNNVNQVFREDDLGYGWGTDLHEIKMGKVETKKVDAASIIGKEWVDKLNKIHLW